MASLREAFGGQLRFDGKVQRIVSSGRTSLRGGVAPGDVDRAMDAINRRVWASPAVLRAFGDEASPRTEWWTDAGERAALLSVADEVRGRPILEVGVGGGRIVPMLRLLSSEYVAIDYTPEMVALCRRLHPDIDVRLGDVRDLSGYPDGSFALVVFTFNGIDAVDHAERSQAFAEMRRILRPGGLLMFSTHNKSGPCFRATPWRPAGAPQRGSWPVTYRIMRWVGGTVLHPGAFPRKVRNWHRLRHLRHDAGGWAIGPVEAHDFDLLIHFITFDAEHEELSRAGFEVINVFDAERGRSISSQPETHDVRYFHFIARAVEHSSADA
jgi:SAM-dependent methyltransferase